jgi:hypothetical protein
MDAIHKLYSKQSYLDLYSIDILLTILPFLIVIVVTSYSTYTAILAKIKNDWNSNRCNPIYMPFAGLIMPQQDQSMLDTTINNFSYCVKQDTSMVFSIVMMPLEFAMFLMIEFLDITMEAIMAAMNLMKWLKEMLGKIFAELYDKILKFIIPVMEITIHVRDTLAKTNAVMVTILYTIMNIYNTTVSGVINLVNVLNDFLVGIISVMLAMIALAVILMVTPAFPAGIAMYATGIGIMSVIVIPTLVIYILMETFAKDIMHETTKKAPKTPKIKKKKK